MDTVTKQWMKDSKDASRKLLKQLLRGDAHGVKKLLAPIRNKEFMVCLALFVDSIERELELDKINFPESKGREDSNSRKI